MLIYDFEQRGNLSKYQYLYQCLKADILSGTLTEGEKMPSKREMAEENGISVKTVMNAYDQLLMEGYLTSRERSGYYVVSDFNSVLRYQEISFPLPAPEEEDEWKADFTANTSVYEKFPFSTWTRVLRQVCADCGADLMRRGDFLGNRELRQEIAKYLYRTRGMVVSPDCIVIGTGIEYLYSKLIKLLPANAVYAVESPGYRKIPHIYDEFDVKWTWTEMDSGGIRMKSLRDSGATVVHVSPEHHYPLGTVMTARRRQELLKWLQESPERYIIEDDYDCEFRYRGHAIPALCSLDYSHRVIYMNTFSKTLSPAIRISYMVLPEKLLKQYVASANFFSNTSSNLEQQTLARFIRDGYFDRHLNRMRKYCYGQGELLRRVIAETSSIPSEGISGVETGTHLLVRLRTDLPDSEVKLRARLKGINLHCLSEFCIGSGEKYRHVLVLNYLNKEEKEIREIAGMLGEIFGKNREPADVKGRGGGGGGRRPRSGG